MDLVIVKPYQYYIDDILGAVYSPETADPDFLRDSAAMYAEACAEVNDRLRNVARLLNRGLRSEAIQIAEQEPNLLETFGILDFPELPAWREMLVNWGMAEPPNLLVDLAGDLNRAYAEHQPIETLMRRHRLLALSRAPLSARISQLRKLATADPNNDTWQSDVEILENARIKQIDGELQAANRSGNLAKLTALFNETKNGGWTAELPIGLSQKAEKYYRQAAAINARSELEKLDQRLNDAHMAFDVVEGRRIRAEWLKLAPIANLSPTDPLLMQTQPAFSWLGETDRAEDKQRQFASAIKNLEQAVEESTDNESLHRLYNTCLTFEEEIPELLEHRVKQRLATQQLANQRKRRLVLGGLVAALALVVAGLGYWMVSRARATAIAEATETLIDLIKKEDFANAVQFHETLPEHLASATPVIQQKSELDRLVNAEKERESSFEESLRLALDSSREDPDIKSLGSARKLAKTSEEKQRIATLESEIASAQRQRQAKENEALSADLQKLRDELQSIELEKNSDDQKVVNLQQLRESVSSLQEKYPRASSTVLSQLSPLNTRIDALVSGIQERQRFALLSDQLTSTVGHPDSYWKKLKQIAEDFPNSPIASNLKTLTEERKLYDGLTAWNTYLQNNFVGKKYFTSDEAKAILKEGTDLQALHGELSMGEHLEARRPYFESVIARDSKGSSKIDEISRLLRDPLVAKLFMIKRKSDGKAFYTRLQPELKDNGTNVKIEFVSGFDLATKNRKIPVDDVQYQGDAPQSLLAKDIQIILNAIPERGWEESLCKALKTTADPQRQIDPILRMIMLQRLLEAACDGSTPLANGFKTYRQTLEEANVDLSVPWMAPDDQLAITERNRADVLLSNLPPIDDSIRATAAAYKEIIKSPDVGYSWLGWLAQDSNGQWSCRSKALPLADGRLVLIHFEPGNKQAAIAEIAAVRDGKITGDFVLSPSQKIMGRPIFFQVSKE